MKQKVFLGILVAILCITAFVLIYILITSNILNIKEPGFDEVALSTQLNEAELQLMQAEEDELITQEYTASNGKTYEIIAILKIPNLNIEYPVLSSTSTELLKVSLNKYWGPNPNRVGNLCILGHNYNDNRFFGKLNQIQNGDIIELTDMEGETLKYSVYDTYIINPDNTDCTSQLTDGRKEITLITCTATGKQRFVVKASEEKQSNLNLE